MPAKPPRRNRPRSFLGLGLSVGQPNLAGITESRQRAIYRALAEAKRAGQDIDDARYAVAKEFVLTVRKVEAIEKEGLDRDWPVV